MSHLKLSLEEEEFDRGRPVRRGLSAVTIVVFEVIDEAEETRECIGNSIGCCWSGAMTREKSEGMLNLLCCCAGVVGPDGRGKEIGDWRGETRDDSGSSRTGERKNMAGCFGEGSIHEGGPPPFENSDRLVLIRGGGPPARERDAGRVRTGGRFGTSDGDSKKRAVFRVQERSNSGMNGNSRGIVGMTGRLVSPVAIVCRRRAGIGRGRGCKGDFSWALTGSIGDSNGTRTLKGDMHVGVEGEWARLRVSSGCSTVS